MRRAPRRLRGGGGRGARQSRRRQVVGAGGQTAGGARGRGVRRKHKHKHAARPQVGGPTPPHHSPPLHPRPRSDPRPRLPTARLRETVEAAEAPALRNRHQAAPHPGGSRRDARRNPGKAPGERRAPHRRPACREAHRPSGEHCSPPSAAAESEVGATGVTAGVRG